VKRNNLIVCVFIDDDRPILIVCIARPTVVLPETLEDRLASET